MNERARGRVVSRERDGEGRRRGSTARRIVLFKRARSLVSVHRRALLEIEPIRVLELTTYRNTLSRGAFRRLRRPVGPLPLPPVSKRT